MSLRSQWLCVGLCIGAVSYVGAVNAPRPASPVEDRPAGVLLEEGVTGQIQDDAGSAVAEAAVLAAPLDADGPAIPEIAIVSDAHGRYEWPLRPGRYKLTVAADGYEPVSNRVVVKAGEVARLDFRLSRRR
jgi:hypothetical protein